MARQMKNVRAAGQNLANLGGVAIRQRSVGEITWTATQAATATTTAVHAAAACSASADQTFTTSITNPSCARNITATTTGTSGDVKAVSVTINGTNINGETISESIGPFQVNTNETITGSKAFYTVTSYVVPQMDGTGCNVSIGVGDKLGLPAKFSRNPVLRAFLANTLEGTAPTVAVSSTAYESNTVDLNSALNGTAVIVELVDQTPA